jgi:hypothetical protein
VLAISLNGPVAFPAGRDDDRSPLDLPGVHRIHCVPQQVDQHLLDLHPVSQRPANRDRSVPRSRPTRTVMSVQIEAGFKVMLDVIAAA